MATVSWSKIQPYQAIRNNCLVTADSAIVAGFSLWLPESYTISPARYNKMNDDLVRLVKTMPTSTVFHFQNFYYKTKFTEKGPMRNIIEEKDHYYFMDRPVMRHYANLYVAFTDRKLSKSSDLSNPVARLTNLISGRNDRIIDALIEKFSADIKAFEGSFGTIKDIEIKRMETEQLRGAVYDYFNQTFDTPIAPELAKGGKIQPLDLEDPEIKKGYLKVGPKYIAVLTLNKEGERLTVHQHVDTAVSRITDVQLSDKIILNHSLTFPLGFELPFNHVLNVAIELTDNDDVKSTFKTEGRSLWAISLVNTRASIKMKDMDIFQSNLDEEHLRSCITMVNVVISDTTPEGLAEKIQMTKSAFGNMNGSDAFVETAGLAGMYVGSAPGYMRINHVGFPQTINQGMCYVPKETQYRADQSGINFVSRMGEPVTVEMWDSKFLPSRNFMMFAETGGGKSFLLNHYLNQFTLQGGHSVVTDRGGSFKKLLELTDNAFYYDSSDKKGLSFAPFVCKQDKNGIWLFNEKDEDGEGGEDVINFIYALILRAWKGSEPASKEEKAIIKKMIVGFYNHVNTEKIFPTFTNFWEYIDVFKGSHKKEEFEDLDGRSYIDFKSLKLVLEPFAYGSNKLLFNSENPISLAKYQTSVFDLEGLKNDADLLDLVTFLIINLANEKFERTKGVRKCLANDEFIDASKGDAGDFVGASYRKARKRGGQIGIVTQNLGFLEEIDPLVRKSIIQNTKIHFLLDHKEKRNEAYPMFEKYLSLTKFDLALLDSIEDGRSSGKRFVEFFLKRGPKSAVYRNEVSEFSEGVYTTSENEIMKIKQLYIKTGNLATAINQFAHEKYKHLSPSI